MVAALSIAGSVLLYLSMFQLASGSRSGGSSMSLTMQRPDQGSLDAEPVSTRVFGLVTD
jgi:hypothetical protein